MLRKKTQLITEWNDTLELTIGVIVGCLILRFVVVLFIIVFEDVDSFMMLVVVFRKR